LAAHNAVNSDSSPAALVLLIVLLTVGIEHPFGTERDVVDLLSTLGLCGLLTLVLGAVVGAGEYRRGTNRMHVPADSATAAAP